MKALVSGGTGFIGKALARRLVEAGWEVLILTRPDRQAQPSVLTGCQYVYCDLGTSGEADFKPFTRGCDVVFHCGAIRNRWGTKPAEYERVNQQGTLNLINASIGNAEKFVYISSVGVYGFPGRCGIDETSPVIDPNLETDYHTSKLMAESIVREKANEISTVIIRPTITYGPGDTYGMVTKLIAMIARGRYLRVGSGRNFIHLTYISDLIHGIMLAADSPRAVSQVYNISGREPITFRDLVNQIGKTLDISIPQMYIPHSIAMTAGHIFEKLYLAGSGIGLINPRLPPLITRQMVLTCCANRSFSAKKAELEIGFQSKVDIAEGINNTVQWMQDTQLISSQSAGVNFRSN
jgi:2-alkyl-3-oxoalkanoate reductase